LNMFRMTDKEQSFVNFSIKHVFHSITTPLISWIHEWGKTGKA
jgi:hypothetical protein